MSQTRPSVTAASSLENPEDAIAAKERCSNVRSWRITLKADEPLTLELLNCSEDTHLQTFKESDTDGWSFPYKHQVLLLEKKQNERIEILATYYSELEFLRIEPGHLKATNTDAVIWTSNVKCGSCLRGPEGVLIWNDTDQRYEWNDSWLESEPQKTLLKGYWLRYDNSLFWSKDHSALYMRSDVYGDEDANCCPNGGNISASIDILNGKLALSTIKYRKPGAPSSRRRR